MRPWICVVSILAAVNAAWSQDAARPTISVTDQAKAIHASSPVIDGHNDLPWAIRNDDRPFQEIDLNELQQDYHTDIPRLRRGGVGAQFWSVYVPVSTRKTNRALSTTLEQIQLVKRMAARYPEAFEIALGTDDINRIRLQGKIASLIGVEGGHCIENSLGALRQLYREGARYMTLTHSETLDWADSCSDEARNDGLSPFGEQVVREMNRIGMLVDISHVSPQCMRDTLRVTRAPVIFSHSSARAVADHPRNVPDDVLQMTAETGGVVMINFYNAYVEPTEARWSLQRSELRDRLRRDFADDTQRIDAELRRWEVAHPRQDRCHAHHVIDHIEHVVKVAGVDHVGLGSDYDGVSAVPKQLEDVSCYPVITQGMLDRGFSEKEIRKVLGENLMRVFEEAETIATGGP